MIFIAALYCQKSSSLTLLKQGGHIFEKLNSSNLGIKLVDPRHWLKCHFLFPLFFSHIYLMNDSKISHMNDNNIMMNDSKISHMNDKNISHQKFTVVVSFSKSAHSTH